MQLTLIFLILYSDFEFFFSSSTVVIFIHIANTMKPSLHCNAFNLLYDITSYTLCLFCLAYFSNSKLDRFKNFNLPYPPSATLTGKKDMHLFDEVHFLQAV